MVRLLVLYNKPIDTDAFEKLFYDTLVPLTKKMPGLRQQTVSRNITPSLRGEAYYMVVELDWDDLTTMQRDFQSAEGQAAAVEAENLAKLSPGTRSMTYALQEL